MESGIKLLQGYCGCLLDNGNVLYITEKGGTFVEFNSRTGELVVLRKEVLKERARNIFNINNVIYVVTAKGRLIAEGRKNEYESIYYEIMDKTQDYGELLYVCNYKDIIYMFYKKEYRIITFNTNTKKIKRFFMEVPEEYKEMKVDAVCFYNGQLCMLSGQDKKMIMYSFEQNRIVHAVDTPDRENIKYMVYESGGFFLLADNTVYELQKEWIPVATLHSDEQPEKMCITKNKIWLFPGKGRDIFVYLRDSGKWEIIHEYPDDLEYICDKTRSKYMSRCNGKDIICWMMYSNNYFVKIEREKESISWIKPQVINKDLISDYVFRQNNILLEKNMDLNDFIYLIQNNKENGYGIL